MEEEFSGKEEGFFNRNKIVSFSIIIACMLFVGIFLLEKAKPLINMIPLLRGEVSLGNNFIITTTKTKHPIIIRKDDPFVGSQLRFSGNIISILSEAASDLCKRGDVVVEVGAYFGYNAINLGTFLKNNGRYYAFEGNYTVYSYLRKSIILNDLDSVVNLKNIAISNKAGYCSIEDCLSLKKTSNGSITNPSIISADCNTLDEELVGEVCPISLLLADIPGSEFAIINGAKRIINNSNDIKILVSFDNELSSKNFDVEIELKKLKSKGFKFYITKSPGNYILANISEVIASKKAALIITKRKL